MTLIPGACTNAATASILAADPGANQETVS